jgi:CBS domain-containing protein
MSAEMPRVTVGEVMHHGVIATPPQTTVGEAATLMSDHGVHCLVVEGLARTRGGQETLVWGILSDLDLMRAFTSGRMQVTAGELASTEIVTVGSDDQVEETARLMTDHECTHLVVVSPDAGEPVGIVSSLDVARALARPETPSP